MVSRIGISTRFRNGQMSHRTGRAVIGQSAWEWDDDNSRCRGLSPLLNIEMRGTPTNRIGQEYRSEALVATLSQKG